MLPCVLMRLQSKQSSPEFARVKLQNCLVSKQVAPLRGHSVHADFVKKHNYAYQGHLQRVGHFLVQGEGAWWHKASADGRMCFHDGHYDPEFFHAGPELLHFCNSGMEDVSRRSEPAGKKPLTGTYPYLSLMSFVAMTNGKMSRIVSPVEHGVATDPEVPFEVLLTMPPPDTSTPVKQHIPEAAALQHSEEHDTQEEGVHTEGCVDMVMPGDAHTEGCMDMVRP